MRDFRDAKAMAQTLRAALKAKSISLTHSESLEIIAKTLGFHDWNVLAARIKSEPKPAITVPTKAVPDTSLAGIPTVPMRDIVLFPRMFVPLFVGRDKTKRALERAVAGDKRVFAVTQKRAGDDDPTFEGLYRVGVTASIIHQLPLSDGTLKVLIQALDRAAVTRLIEGEFLAAEIAPVEERRGDEASAAILARTVLDAYQAYANVNLSAPPQALTQLPHIREAGVLADTVAPLLSIGIEQRQALLETGDVIERLEKILELMKTERKTG
jgi:uncharacterized protein